MASPDLKDSYNQASSKIDAVSTYNQVASDKDNLLKTLGNKAENSKEKIVDQIIAAKQKAENFKKKVQSEVDNQMELIKQLILKAKSSALDKSNVPTETVTLLKDKFIKIAYKAKPIFKEILVEEIVNLVGCNQQQQYTDGQVIYVSIPDIDLFKSLKSKLNHSPICLFSLNLLCNSFSLTILDLHEYKNSISGSSLLSVTNLPFGLIDSPILYLLFALFTKIYVCFLWSIFFSI